jgi:hypothetical protein
MSELVETRGHHWGRKSIAITPPFPTKCDVAEKTLALTTREEERRTSLRL